MRVSQFLTITFDPVITLGHIGTTLAVVVSVAALLYSWGKDRQARRREVADRVRTAAANTLTGLTRMAEIMGWFYSDADPIYVLASEKLAEGDKEMAVRDFLWRELHTLRSKSLERAFEEKLETAYGGLLAYDSTVLDWFSGVTRSMKQVDQQQFTSFLSVTQDAVHEVDDPNMTSELGNELRRKSEWPPP